MTDWHGPTLTLLVEPSPDALTNDQLAAGELARAAATGNLAPWQLRHCPAISVPAVRISGVRRRVHRQVATPYGQQLCLEFTAVTDRL